MKKDRRNTDVRLITATVQRLVKALVLLNFPGSAETPEFVMEDSVGIETERADRDVPLSQIGVEFTPEYFTDKYDLEPDGTFYSPAYRWTRFGVRYAGAWASGRVCVCRETRQTKVYSRRYKTPAVPER